MNANQTCFRPLSTPSTATLPDERGGYVGMTRRRFVRCALALAGGCTLCSPTRGLTAGVNGGAATTQLVSPGCRRSRLKVAKLYLGTPGGHWPTPKLDLEAERRRYEAAFDRMKDAFADVDFTGNRLLSKVEELDAVRDAVREADGVLLIHLSMGIGGLLRELLGAGRPTVLFAVPYSGHEWSGFGALRKEPLGAKFESMLTSDLGELAAAVRPFRALHHLREARILNVTARALPATYTQAVATRFGTEIRVLPQPRVLGAYEAVSPAQAEAEARRWIRGATRVVEPTREEIVNSCRLALAFERLLAEEEATCLTVDCYGTMYRKLPAFPCVGFVRLNDMGLAGICESDLTSAMTFLLLQGLSGRPGFISDPTLDTSKQAIVLAHCLGTRRMDGPSGPMQPYKLRTIMERQEGCVPQVTMRVGQRVTQALLVGTEKLLYFTGTIVEAPDIERGCRTKMTVRVDGDIEKLWQNWGHGLHRVTCYGEVTADLKRFCRFAGLEMVNEA